MDQTMSIAEVARRAGVSRQAVWEALAERGTLSGTRDPVTGNWQITAAAFTEWAAHRSEAHRVVNVLGSLKEAALLRQTEEERTK